MSAIHKCNDGGEDCTGRLTPDKEPCKNQGGLLGSTPTGNVTTAGFGNIPQAVWWIAGLGAIYYVGKKQKWF